MQDLFQPLTFGCGASMKNRFMLAPLTNSQSHEDGTLSDEERHWLTMRAKGGFGLTMTCAIGACCRALHSRRHAGKFRLFIETTTEAAQ